MPVVTDAYLAMILLFLQVFANFSSQNSSFYADEGIKGHRKLLHKQTQTKAGRLIVDTALRRRAHESGRAVLAKRQHWPLIWQA